MLYYFLESPFKPKATQYDASACFVNVSHDKQLVSIDMSDPFAGRTDITDRAKLLDFLKIANKTNYKYILLDIRFDAKYVTEYDSLLYQQIASMKNIVIAHHKNDVWSSYSLADTILKNKIGMADYKYIGLSSSFSHYAFLQDGKPSMALKMYDEIHHQHTSIKQFHNLPIYISEGHLCTNCPLLPIYGNVYSIMESMGRYEDDEIATGNDTLMLANYYEDLGSDFLLLDGRDFAADFDNKIIVIGDFENDIHYTYSGKVPGPYIIYLAFIYLQNKHHLLRWPFIIIMLCYYSLTIFLLFFLNEISQKSQPKKSLSLHKFIPLLRWLGSFGLLYFVTFIMYRFFLVRYNVTIPILFITFTNFIIQKANYYEKNSFGNPRDIACLGQAAGK